MRCNRNVSAVGGKRTGIAGDLEVGVQLQGSVGLIVCHRTVRGTDIDKVVLHGCVLLSVSGCDIFEVLCFALHLMPKRRR